MIPTTSFPRRLALLACALTFATACRGFPFRGPDYPWSAEPFRKTGLPEVPRLSDEPIFRVILAGDAGLAARNDPTLRLLRKWGDEYAARTYVVYLGDNLYPDGLEKGDRRGEAVLRRQIRATRAKKLFIPGNHDWGSRGRRALNTGVLENQQRFIEAHAKEGAEFLPKDGCPGPAEVELVAPGQQLSRGLTVLALDLHWWLLPEDLRPVCEGITDTNEFLERFGDALKAHRGRNLLVVAHHPIRSGGPHGGLSRGFWTDLGVTIAYPFYRAQDTFEPGYAGMVNLLSKAMEANPPLAMVGGHDHSLQILAGGDVARLVIVSGAASRLTKVTHLDETLFAHAHLGFVVMDFYRLDAGTEETALVRVVETGRGNDPVFTIMLDLTEEQAPAEPVVDPGRGRGASAR